MSQQVTSLQIINYLIIITDINSWNKCIISISYIINIKNTMSGSRSMSPAQIQFLRVGPKAGNSDESKKLITQALIQQKNKFFAGEASNTSSLNKISKMTYGEFQKTVTNFGVLINKNFGNETSLHQSQKFGKMAVDINKILIQEKDKPMYNEKKNALLKKIKDRSDNRTAIKAVYSFENTKLHVSLKSFSLDSDKSSPTGLPIPYLRFLVSHVNSGRLTKIIQPSLKVEGNQITVQFDKIEGRASHLSNNEAKYQSMQYEFERFGQTMNLILPSVEFDHPESSFKQEVQILNKQILEIIESNFQNVSDIVDKYLDTQSLEAAIKGPQQGIEENGEEENKEDGDD